MAALVTGFRCALIVLVAFLILLCSFTKKDKKPWRPANFVKYVNVKKNNWTKKPNTNLSSGTCHEAWKESRDFNEFNSHKPLIYLDRTKFILPYLRNGPNNQLIGLRDSIYLAIRLNRTIVIPTFFKHRSDSNRQMSKTITAEHRVDLSHIGKLIPFVTYRKFNESCQGKMDAIFRTRVMSGRKLSSLATEMGLKVNVSSVLQYPLNEEPDNAKKFFTYDASAKTINKMFDSKARCAFHPYPFKNMRMRERKPTGKAPLAIELSKMSDEGLYTEIIRFTRLPVHIKHISSEFVKEVMKGRPYLSLHWRFDKDDWMRRCNIGGNIPERRQHSCNVVKNLSPANLSDAISAKLKQVDGNIRDVYVASPLVVKPFISKVKSLLATKANVRVFTSDNLMGFWRKRYKTCKWLWYDSYDILSTMEMEICSRGNIFLRAASSSWSGNVDLMRTQDVTASTKNDVEILKWIFEFRQT